MNKTAIEWVKNPDGSRPGWVWNPITGCLNNCSYCYARKLANGRLKARYLANDNISKARLFPEGELNKTELDRALSDPFYPRFWHDRIVEPNQIKKPRGIFVCDMGELFGDWLPRKWQEAIFITFRQCPQHRFYLLTKQDQNLEQFSPFPDNCWVGISVDGRDLGRPIYFLNRIKAKIKFISFEPLLYPITQINLINNLGWVIIGAQTKPYKPPEISWVKEMADACDKAGVPMFMKDNLLRGICFTDGRIRFRQEIPR